jgi:hypothetical protein
MKLAIQIEYTNGEVATYIAQPPEWAKWEQKTGNTIQQAQDKVGISDLMFLAFHAMKREAGGKPVKPYEVWSETISDLTVGESVPKAISAEV